MVNATAIESGSIGVYISVRSGALNRLAVVIRKEDRASNFFRSTTPGAIPDFPKTITNPYDIIRRRSKRGTWEAHESYAYPSAYTYLRQFFKNLQTELILFVS
jgi:hypothetical protein